MNVYPSNKQTMDQDVLEYFSPGSARSDLNKPVRRQSESSENLSIMKQINDNNVFDKLMSCPLRRKLVLNILASERNAVDNRNQVELLKSAEKNNTPGSSGKVRKKKRYESPVALFRRRALEQQSGSPSNFLQNDDRPNSRLSEAASSVSASPILFEKILNGVIAFVDVNSNGQDRSQGVKILMKNLGADVRDSFAKDVTHVVFKVIKFLLLIFVNDKRPKFQ